MTQVYVICEGQTEATFVQELLRPHFRVFDKVLTPTLIGKHGQKGGDVRFVRILHSLKPLLLSGHQPYCTSLIDFYGLPNEFPGKLEAMYTANLGEKALLVSNGLMSQLKTEIDDYALNRFIPYVQMHEFEGLLFSDPAGLASGIDKPRLARRFASVRDRFSTPEHINDNPQTAPGRQIARIYPEYEKPTMGVLAALEIGLAKIRQECPLFSAWLHKLENLPSPPA